MDRQVCNARSIGTVVLPVWVSLLVRRVMLPRRGTSYVGADGGSARVGAGGGSTRVGAGGGSTCVDGRLILGWCSFRRLLELHCVRPHGPTEVRKHPWLLW